PNSGYYRTTRYPLKKGEKISVRGNTDKLVHMRKVAVFDSNGNPLTQFGLDRMPSDGTVSTYTAEDDAITEVVLSIGYSSTNYGIEPENLMISYGDVPDRFSRQMHNATPDIGVSDTQLRIIREELNVEPSNLVGRTILSTGDSIQAGDGNKGAGFTEIAASQLGMVCKDYAVGGATFCREIQPTNNIVDQLLKAFQRETRAPDFLTTNGLTNDIGSPNAPIGSVTTSFNVSDYDLSTFSGSMEYYFYQARTQWPSTKIIYVRVHNMATRGRDKQIEFGERAEEICYKWSVPVVNVYRDGNLNTNITEQRKLYSNPTEANPNGDSTHPNQAGYEFAYVPLLINQLKSM
ncbi:MAG: SGNH/GDSL hydrolase family protein, partial [Enterococcus sp.]